MRSNGEVQVEITGSRQKARKKLREKKTRERRRRALARAEKKREMRLRGKPPISMKNVRVWKTFIGTVSTDKHKNSHFRRKKGRIQARLEKKVRRSALTYQRKEMTKKAGKSPRIALKPSMSMVSSKVVNWKSAGHIQRAKERQQLRRRRNKRQKKMRNQRFRRLRHIQGKFGRRQELKEQVKKMSVVEIKEMLNELKISRDRKMRRRRMRLKNMCRRKRRAEQMIRLARRKARHRRKKHLRFKRWLYKEAKGQNIDLDKKDKPKKIIQERVTWKRIWPKTKRYPYENEHKAKPVKFEPDVNSEAVRMMAETKYMLSETLACMFQYNVKGKFGIENARVLYPKTSIFLDFRYTSKIVDDNAPMEEVKILSRLAKIGSKNSVRVMFTGHFSGLQYCLTTQFSTSLADILNDHKVLPQAIVVHIVEQTLWCMRDLHKIGYCHLQIRPSSFSTLKENQFTFVFKDFHIAKTFSKVHNEVSNLREESSDNDEDENNNDYDEVRKKRKKKRRVKKNIIDPYMSRRQHFRSCRGPADDFESWFYVCARIVNAEPLKWEKQDDHFKMAMSKYEFPQEYGHPDEDIHGFMTSIHEYVLTVTIENAVKVAYCIQEILDEWKGKFKALKTVPWNDDGRYKAKIEKKEKKEAEDMKEDEEELKKEWKQWEEEYEKRDRDDGSNEKE
uniref:Protein kinase domain-containing protein n=2 Tax=Caenorhabditis japonica TaxID=281687 RepID=A0A8R1HMA8_CAEJA